MPADSAAPGLDDIGWLIATLHQLLGHDKAAAVLGQDPGDKEACLVCAHEANPTEESRLAVIAALAPLEGGQVDQRDLP